MFQVYASWDVRGALEIPTSWVARFTRKSTELLGRLGDEGYSTSGMGTPDALLEHPDVQSSEGRP